MPRVPVIVLVLAVLAGCGGDDPPAPAEASPSAAAPGTATATVIASPTPSPRPRRTATPSSSRGVLPAGAAASFARLGGGRNGLAVMPAGGRGQPELVGSLRGGVAWSTAKLPIAMAVIARGGGSSSAADLRAAITASDNPAAERLWTSLGAPERAGSLATSQLRAAGDRQTTIETSKLRPEFTAFGQTDWSLAAAARFAAGLPCLDAGRSVLRLMGNVVDGQRWGLFSIDRRAQAKGGWGPGDRPGQAGGYFNRQLGIVTIDGKPLAVAIATVPTDGTHEAGIAQLDRIAAWLRDHADTTALPTTPRC